MNRPRCRTRLAVVLGLVPALAGALRADPDDLAHATAEPLDDFGEGRGHLQPAAHPAVTFAVVGDFGLLTTGEARVAAMIRGWAPEFVLTTGDNNYGSLDPDPGHFTWGQTDWTMRVGLYYGSFMQGRGDGRYPEQTSPVQRFFPAVGNHDSFNRILGTTGGGSIDGYVAYLHENPGGPPRLPVDRGAVHDSVASYYVVRRGPADIFVLDSNVAYADAAAFAAMRAWFDTQLAASSARWKFASFHHPPFASGSGGDHPQMQWPELARLTAMFCGHDHDYERLHYGHDGPPIFVSGSGGINFGFYLQPTRQTEFRYGGQAGALRVTMDDSGVVIESRASNQTTGTEDLVESYTLGTLAEDDRTDDFTFFAEQGVIAHLTTSTPLRPGATPPDPPLDPALELYGPAGSLLAENANGATDGCNADMVVRLTETGRYRIRVRTETAGAGDYVVHVGIERPKGDFASWVTRHVSPGATASGWSDDADDDGWQNGLEYAFGLPPAAERRSVTDLLHIASEADDSGSARRWRVSFDVPSPLPTDVRYQLEMSPDLAADSWTVLARKPPLEDWTSAARIELTSPAPDRRRVSVWVPVAPDSSRRFFRLGVAPNQGF